MSERPAAAARPAASAERHRSFPIVALGASAGGLEALTHLLQNMPGDAGMAFVIVQHLDPTHPSILTGLLGAASPMPVQEVTDGMVVERDHVYVIPPNTTMEIDGGVLKLTPREGMHHLHRPVDTFFHSLARDHKNKAIGVVLSGTASDGALGLRAIKEEGGITFAQEPESAKFDGMPAAAIAGGVDFILPPDAIARELVNITRHPYLVHPFGDEHAEDRLFDGDRLDAIFGLIRAAKGVDFTHYKQSTIRRRVLRRMLLNKIEQLAHYVEYLKRNPAEVTALHNDILINVTQFFRDGGAFDALKTVVLPEIARQRSSASPIRVWVPGCSGGEEAYSIAMCLYEFLGSASASTPVQIFATDLSDAAIEKTRAGIYTEAKLLGLSPERQRRFLTRTNGGYQVVRAIRDMCVFARQDVTRDPPFSRLDLISCRNLLIYLGNVLQKRVIPMFHYSLKPNGFLMLGSSESIGGFAELFTLVDKPHKIYAKKPGVFHHYHHDVRHSDLHVHAGPQRSDLVPPGGAELAGIERDADRMLLARFSPPGVLISEDMNILQFRGQAGPYLEPAPGKASLHLSKMARPELQVHLRKAVAEAAQKAAAVKVRDVGLRSDGVRRRINIEVVPMTGVPPEHGRYFVVLFEENTAPAAQPPRGREVRAKRGNRGDTADAEKLRQELLATRQYLQSVIEQQEAANGELRSANEEAHSTNEELNTLNEELHTVNQEVAQVNNDLNNLLDSVDIPIVMLAGDLRIRRFTPAAARLLNMIGTDVGRPLGDLRPNIEAPGLEDMILKVVKGLQPAQTVVHDREGRHYDLRIKPYRTADNRIDGVVMTVMEKAGEAAT